MPDRDHDDDPVEARPVDDPGRQKPRLSLARLVAGALEVAHDIGADRMTMKDVATHLSVGTMSLYYYVPDKAALLVQMAGELYARVEIPPVHVAWDDRLRTMLTQVYEGFVSVPGLEPAVQYGEPALAHYARVLDAALVALCDSGMDRGAAFRAALVFTGYAANRGAASARRAHLARTSPEVRDAIVEQMGSLHDSLLGQVLADAADVPHHEVFAFGLELMLDGVRTRHRRAPGDA